MVKIAQIAPGSIAEELQLEIGSRIVRINGELVRDVIDYRFLEADATLEVEVATPLGESIVFEIEKDAGEALGVVPATDTVRQCANKCVFCFVDGNPQGARKSLHLKDDDFRLSFTYGSYVTLTNLGPKGFQRLIDQRLSPLYVSVHATEPDVRERLLGVALGGGIVDQLRELTGAGLEVHTQVVLCPEWNDGEHLERTISDLYALGPGILSLSIVPVGLTSYNINKPVRLLTEPEAAQALRQVDAARARSLRERGMGWVYAGDEMFFAAGEPVPAPSYYDDWPLTENGVGAVRRFVDDFEDGLPALPRMPGQHVGIVTGTRMAQVIAPLAQRLGEHTGARVDVLGVVNRMYGETVTTAGLLPGRDIADAIRRSGAYDVILLPAEALNDNEVFVDDIALETMREMFGATVIVAGYELTETLSRAVLSCDTDYQQ